MRFAASLRRDLFIVDRQDVGKLYSRLVAVHETFFAAGKAQSRYRYLGWIPMAIQDPSGLGLGYGILASLGRREDGGDAGHHALDSENRD